MSCQQSALSRDIAAIRKAIMSSEKVSDSDRSTLLSFLSDAAKGSRTLRKLLTATLETIPDPSRGETPQA